MKYSNSAQGLKHLAYVDSSEEEDCHRREDQWKKERISKDRNTLKGEVNGQKEYKN